MYIIDTWRMKTKLKLLESSDVQADVNESMQSKFASMF